LFRLIVVLLCVLTACGGCSRQDLVEELSTPQERAQAETAIAAARTQNVAALLAQATPIFATQLNPRARQVMAQSIPSAPAHLRSVFVQTSISGAPETIKALDYEVASGQHAVIVRVILRTSPAPVRLHGLHVSRVAIPSAANDLAAVPLSIGRIVWVGVMIAAVVTSLAGVVAAFRRRRGALRWRWMAASALPVGTFSFNWTTGGLTFQPFHVLLFGAAGFRAGPFSPWLFSAAAPLGALIFLYRSRRQPGHAEPRGTP
jgi:hypothetical protein